MAKPNFGYKGSGLTTTDAIAAGATVTTGNYVYLTQLDEVTPSTVYPDMEPDPGGGGGGETPVISITTQPTNATVTNGTGAWSVVASTTSGTLTYQWQRSTGLGSSITWGDISGATSSSYTRTQMTPFDDSFRFYRVVVSCVGATSVTSNDVGYAANQTWYGYFNNPNARWTAIFGATTGTTGSSASHYVGSSSGETWDANPSPSIRASNAGTMRITGAVTGDDAFVIKNYLGNTLFSTGSSNGLDETLNATITGVIAGDSITIEGAYLAFTNLNVWIQ